MTQYLREDDSVGPPPFPSKKVRVFCPVKDFLVSTKDFSKRYFATVFSNLEKCFHDNRLENTETFNPIRG
jgi:hypothetical protein